MELRQGRSNCGLSRGYGKAGRRLGPLQRGIDFRENNTVDETPASSTSTVVLKHWLCVCVLANQNGGWATASCVGLESLRKPRHDERVLEHRYFKVGG